MHLEEEDRVVFGFATSSASRTDGEKYASISYEEENSEEGLEGLEIEAKVWQLALLEHQRSGLGIGV